MYFCIPWGILANVKISRLSAFSSWLCDLFLSCVALGLHRRATHEGNKSHNPSVQANNPYLFDRAYFLLVVMVEGNESSRLTMANKPAILAGYRPLLTAQIGKFWKHGVDLSALDSILQNHLPLLATLPWNFSRWISTDPFLAPLVNARKF